jgi:hypothetical protein
MTETREIELESWDRIATHNFDIEYGLIGKSHVFPYLGASITVSLPSFAQISDASREAGYVHSWQKVDGQEIPISAFVHVVDVSVRRGHCIAVPVDVFNRHPNAYDLIREEDQKRLNALAAEANDIASNAFEYWLSVLRWKSGKHHVGRPGVPATNTWSTYLRESGSAAVVWAGSHIIRVSKTDPVTQDAWESAQAALAISSDVPIHLRFFDDAQESWGRHEYRRSIIELAIACEVFMRTPVLRSLPSDLDPGIREMVELANINQYVNKFFPNLLSEEGRVSLKKLTKELSSLFNARNKIMHMAEEDRASAANCSRFSSVAETLFDIGTMVAE